MRDDNGALYTSQCSLPGILHLIDEEYDDTDLFGLISAGSQGNTLEPFAFLILRQFVAGDQCPLCPESQAVRIPRSGVRPFNGTWDELKEIAK